MQHDGHASRVEDAAGPLLTAEEMRRFGDRYLSDVAHAEGPRASVQKAPDLSGVAPAVVATAAFDPLRDEGDAYAAALEAAGVQVVHRRYDGLVHGSFGLGPISPACAAAVRELCADLRRLLVPR